MEIIKISLWNLDKTKKTYGATFEKATKPKGQSPVSLIRKEITKDTQKGV